MAMCVPVLCAAQLPEGAAPVDDGAEMAKKLANPISDSMPFQLNWEEGVGPNDQTRFILNVQPVMPFSVKLTADDPGVTATLPGGGTLNPMLNKDRRFALVRPLCTCEYSVFLGDGLPGDD